MGVSGFGLFLSALAGLPSIFKAQAFMTSQWLEVHVFGVEIALSTPLFFDIGVYLVVVGAIGSIALALEEREAD
jgi:multicomponent Na+:H+ antiporter subunit B